MECYDIVEVKSIMNLKSLSKFLLEKMGNDKLIKKMYVHPCEIKYSFILNNNYDYVIILGNSPKNAYDVFQIIPDTKIYVKK